MNRAEFITLVTANPVNRAILERLPRLGLTDAWLVSGALFQTAWNGLTGREPTYGIKDYDVFYFDDTDLSWEAEDQAITRVQTAFGDIEAEVEVRNQARVHLWYEKKFGSPCPPLRSAPDSIGRFLAPVCMIGIRPALDGLGDVYAPMGFADIANMTVRPNNCPNFSAERYEEKAHRWKRTWPQITILPAKQNRFPS